MIFQTLLPGALGIAEEECEQRVIPVEKLMQHIEIRVRGGAKLALDGSEAQLVGRGHLAGIVPSGLRAQDQQAGIAKPVPEQQGRAYRDNRSCDEFNHAELDGVVKSISG